MDKAQITILQEQIMERMDLSKQLSGEEIREMIDKQLMAEGKRRYLELAGGEKRGCQRKDPKGYFSFYPSAWDFAGAH